MRQEDKAQVSGPFANLTPEELLRVSYFDAPGDCARCPDTALAYIEALKARLGEALDKTQAGIEGRARLW